MSLGETLLQSTALLAGQDDRLRRIRANPATSDLSDPDTFVILQTEAPLGVLQTVLQGSLRVLGQIWPVEWLKKEVVEIEVGK